MAKKKEKIIPYCKYCKYKEDYQNYMITCKYQAYPIPSNWVCDVNKFELKKGCDGIINRRV